MAKTVKFPEAAARLFDRVFICRNCGAKLRTDALKVKNKKVKCRKCKGRVLRLKHKEIRGT